jgi:hypothetical protein
MAPRINFKHKKEVPFEERVRESQRVRERHAATLHEAEAGQRRLNSLDAKK